MPPAYTRLTTRLTPRRATPLTLALAASLTLGLTACGGGDGSSSNEEDSATQDATSASYAASSVSATSDASTALNVSVSTTEAVVAKQIVAIESTRGRTTAQAVRQASSPTVTVYCAGGGSATVSATGPTLSGLTDDTLDEGEVFTLTFTNCQQSTGAPAVNGSLITTVLAPVDGARRLQLSASALRVALPSSTVTIDGGLIFSSYVASVGGSNVPPQTITYASVDSIPATALTLTAVRNGRSASLAVSNLSLDSQSSASGGTQSSFSCSFAATTPNGSFSGTLASSGQVSTDANGKPVSGIWSLTLPNSLVAVTLNSGSGVVTIDNGKNGSIDRTIPVTVDALLALI